MTYVVKATRVITDKSEHLMYGNTAIQAVDSKTAIATKIETNLEHTNG